MSDMFGRAGEACLGACQSWHADTARFLLKRFERDAELAWRLLGCHDWSDALRLQQDCGATAMRDYLDQTRRVAGTAGKLCPLDLTPQESAVTDDRRSDAVA
jgi:hypothetical protein